MTTSTSRRTIALASMLALPFVLTACSDDGDDDPTTDGRETVSEDENGGGGDDTDSDDTDGDDGADNGDKSPREDYREGLITLMAASGTTEEDLQVDGAPDDLFDFYIDCVVDNTYDQLSAPMINSVAAGEEPGNKASAEDQTTFQTEVTTCSTETQAYLQEHMSNP